MDDDEENRKVGKRKIVPRRNILQLSATGFLGSLAGCNHNNSSTTTNQTQATTRSSRNNSQKSPPKITNLDAVPSQEKGTITVNLSVHDDGGIQEIVVTSPTGSTTKTVNGVSKYSGSLSVASPPGTRSEITITVTDSAGSQTTKKAHSYARAHTKATGPWNIGARYNPTGGNWNCTAGTPAVGEYNRAVQRQLVTTHIDQLTAGGISRIQWEFRYERPTQKLLNILSDSPLDESVAIEFKYDLNHGLKRQTVKRDLKQLATVLQSSDLLSTLGSSERPVITIGGVASFSNNDEQSTQIRTQIRDSFGSLTSLVETIRNQLTVEGNDPYLIAQLGMPGSTEITKKHPDYLSMVSQFDAVTHSFWPYDLEETDYLTVMSRLQATYRTIWRWATDHEVDFIPIVPAGFDNRANDCWNTKNGYVERNPSKFRRALAVATEYATKGRVTIQSFNDWMSGTQIEPGTWRDTSYGMQYLNAIADVQQNGSEQKNRSEYIVSPSGRDDGPGSPGSPLRTIGHALFRAKPGDTIRVRPGRYYELLETVRSGQSGSPITITGPREARFVGGWSNEPFKVRHSHIHITGMTFDGLQNRPHPEKLSSFAGNMIHVQPYSNDGWVENIVIQPHAAGNTSGSLISVKRSSDVDVGDFKLIGPTGVAHFVFDRPGHDGEIVYIGTPPLPKKRHVWNGVIDRTHDVRVHHIDASAGYAHSEIADVKGGAYDVTIEYNTSVGARSKGGSGAAVMCYGKDVTVRWNHIEDSHYQGVTIAKPDNPRLQNPATSNSIYGNRFRKIKRKSLHIASDVNIEEQQYICGNDIEPPTDDSPGKTCPREVPSGKGIGHTAGR